jgi:quercetin dioxygenase-like cupin family protein
MQIIIRNSENIPQEEAHGGSGKRRLYIAEKESPSQKVQGMTHGWLPAGEVFDWHDHPGIEEIAYVMKGAGIVADEDGEYPYKAGDVLIFPADKQHKIANPTDETNEFIFIRIYV